MKFIKPNQLIRHHDVVYHDWTCKMYSHDCIKVADRHARKLGRACKRCHEGG